MADRIYYGAAILDIGLLNITLKGRELVDCNYNTVADSDELACGDVLGALDCWDGRCTLWGPGSGGLFEDPLGIGYVVPAASMVDGVTITHGWGDPRGGAISIVNSSPTIVNCVLKENSALNSGGGIYIDEGNPVLRNCTIVENYAPAAAGAYCRFSSPLIINCKFIRNTTRSWAGGGLYLDRGSPTLINCMIIGNYAIAAGGVFCRSTDTATEHVPNVVEKRRFSPAASHSGRLREVEQSHRRRTAMSRAFAFTNPRPTVT